MKANAEHMKEELNNIEINSEKDKKENSKVVANKETKLNDKNNKTIEKNINVEKEVKTETKAQEVKVLPQVSNEAKEPIPQTGKNDVGLIVGIVVFSFIGLGSLVKYIKLK